MSWPIPTMGEVSNVLAGVVAVFYLLAAVCAVRELLYGRSSQGTIAWLLSLVFFPYVTVFAYLAFGWKRFDDYVKIRRPADRIDNDLPEPRRLLALRADFENKQAAAAWPWADVIVWAGSVEPSARAAQATSTRRSMP